MSYNMVLDEPEKPTVNQEIADPDVITGHRNCQTAKSRWLCLTDIYEKFFRNHIYDAGGTYVQDLPDYWFTYKTEQVGNIFLLHIFAVNNVEGTYTIGLSNGNDLQLDKKNKIARLSQTLKYATFTIQDKKHPAYVETYSFSHLDIEFLKDMKLYIAIRFDDQPKNVEFVEKIKAEHDCRVLLKDPVGADFTIESADGVKFNVHKILLATQSDVFKAMLKDETAESQNNLVRLIDVATEDVQAMLEFIYSGTILNTDNINLGNLLMLSDRYDLKGLRELCNHALGQQISVDNALDILSLADMYDCHILKIKALKFIKMHRDSLQSSSFIEINNLVLMRELCAYLAS